MDDAIKKEYLAFFFINVTIRECNFAMGTILGKGLAQAQVHTNHSTSAEGISAVMYARVLVQNSFPRLSLY